MASNCDYACSVRDIDGADATADAIIDACDAYALACGTTCIDPDPATPTQCNAPEVPTSWTCNPNYYGDGDRDFGCSALDVDCASALTSICAYCSDCPETGSCSHRVHLTDNALC